MKTRPFEESVAIDNNPAERALRPIGISRKNWLFTGVTDVVPKNWAVSYAWSES